MSTLTLTYTQPPSGLLTVIASKPGLHTTNSLLASVLFSNLYLVQSLFFYSPALISKEAQFFAQPALQAAVFYYAPTHTAMDTTPIVHPYFWPIVFASLFLSCFIGVITTATPMHWPPPPPVSHSKDVGQDQEPNLGLDSSSSSVPPESTGPPSFPPPPPSFDDSHLPEPSEPSSWFTVLLAIAMGIIISFGFYTMGRTMPFRIRIRSPLMRRKVIVQHEFALPPAVRKYAPSSLCLLSDSIISPSLTRVTLYPFTTATAKISTFTHLVATQITTTSLDLPTTSFIKPLVTPAPVVKFVRNSVEDVWAVYSTGPRYTFTMRVFPQGIRHFFVLVVIATIASLIALFIINYITHLLDHAIWRIWKWHLYSPVSKNDLVLPSPKSKPVIEVNKEKALDLLRRSCAPIAKKVAPSKSFADLVQESHAVQEAPGDRVLYARPVQVPNFMLEHNLVPKGESIAIVHGLPLHPIKEVDEPLEDGDIWDDAEETLVDIEEPFKPKIEIVYDPGCKTSALPRQKMYFVRNGLAYDISCQLSTKELEHNPPPLPKMSNIEANGYVKIIYPTPIDPEKLRLWLSLEIECSFEEAEMFEWF